MKNFEASKVAIRNHVSFQDAGKLPERPDITSCEFEGAQDILEKFSRELVACERGSFWSTCFLKPGDKIVVNGFELTIGSREMGGVDGSVYQLSDPKLFLKKTNDDVCKEKAIMKALNGLGGFFPKVYEIESDGYSGRCMRHLVVMDKVGDKDLSNLRGKDKRDAYRRCAAIIKATRTLHELGITHEDFHEGNVRFDSTNPSVAFIIDFGRSAFGDSKFDDVRLVSHIYQLLIGTNMDRGLFDWVMDTVSLILVNLEKEDCPDYDLLVWMFENLEQSTNQLQEFFSPILAKGYQNWAMHAGRFLNKDRLLRYPRTLPIGVEVEAFTNFSPYQSSLHPRLVDIVKTIALHDERFPETRPQLAFDGERIKVPGQANNDEMVDEYLYFQNKFLQGLGRGGFSGTQEFVQSSPIKKREYVVQYYHNCNDLDGNLMDVQRKYGLVKLAYELQAGPGPVWISPAVKLPPWRSAKLSFNLPDDLYAQCAKDPRSHVRSIVISSSLSVEPDWIMFDEIAEYGTPIDRFKRGLVVGIDLMNKLRNLHQAGVVYGKVDLVYIQSFKIGGIDQYGFNFLKNGFFSGEEKFSKIEKPGMCQYSHWVMDGSEIGFRDDVLNVLFLISWFVTKDDWSKYCEKRGKTRQDVWRFMAEDFPFETITTEGTSQDWIEGILSQPEIVEPVKKELKDALILARSVNSASDLPDHDTIIEHLSNALEMIKN